MLAERKITLDLAIKGTNLQTLVKQAGEADLLKSIANLLIMSSEFFNTSNQISEMQAIQTASLLIDNYGTESFEDIVLCLKNVKTGRYGKIYNRIDGQMVFEWFQSYLQEKSERIEAIKHNEKFEHINNETHQLAGIAHRITPLIAKGNEQASPPVNRLSSEKHFNSFINSIDGLSATILEGLLEYFSKENAKCHFPHFDNYITELKTRIKNLTK